MPPAERLAAISVELLSKLWILCSYDIAAKDQDFYSRKCKVIQSIDYHPRVLSF